MQYAALGFGGARGFSEVVSSDQVVGVKGRTSDYKLIYQLLRDIKMICHEKPV